MVLRAGKKKQPLPVDTDTKGIAQDEGELSLQVMMATMGAMLTTFTTRMVGLEKRQGAHDDTATSHMLCTALPEVSTSEAATSHPPARETLAELDAYPDVTEEVGVQVAQHLWGAPAPHPLTR